MKKKINLLKLSKEETSAVKAGKEIPPTPTSLQSCGCACWNDAYGGSNSSQVGGANFDLSTNVAH